MAEDFAGFGVVWGYPLAFFVTLRMFLCPQCMNLACPLNNVLDPVRVKFFGRDPTVAETWSHGSSV